MYRDGPFPFPENASSWRNSPAPVPAQHLHQRQGGALEALRAGRRHRIRGDVQPRRETESGQWDAQPVAEVAGRGERRGDPEDILSGQLEYGQPVVDLAAGDAHALVAAPRNALRTVAALVSAQSEGVDQPAFEAGMGLEITPQLALDGSGLVFAGAVSLTYPRPPAPAPQRAREGSFRM